MGRGLIGRSSSATSSLVLVPGDATYKSPVIIMNVGKDGSRAFVTGDFSDGGLTDDVSGLTNIQWLDLLHWFEFYNREYIYVGRIYTIFCITYEYTARITNIKFLCLLQ